MSRLGNFVNIKTGKLDANASSANGQYPFFTCSIEPLRIDAYSYDCECVLVAGNGDLNVKYYNGKFDAYQRTYIIESKNKDVLSVPYLYCFLDKYVEELRKQSIGGVIKYIKLGNLTEAQIPMYSIAEQNEVVANLNKVDTLISIRKQQLSNLDKLVKSRFIEMFGTLSNNEHNYPTSTLKEVCRKITDGKHGGCEQEQDSGYYYVGAREIYDGEIHYDTAPQITRSDFEKDYRRCNLEQGDFVLVNTGATIGKSAIAKHPLTEYTLLQKSVAMFKVKPKIISAVFLKYCYEANPEMYTVESASAQPNLLLSRINSTLIYIPPIELQTQFATFVEQIDKSKFEIQKSLEKLETLKKALMQKYFG